MPIMKTLVKLHDDTGKKFLFDPDQIKSVEQATGSALIYFLRRKGKHVVNVKHVSPAGLSISSMLYFNKWNRAMATATRLKSLIVTE